MRKELEKLTKKQLIELVETFEYYPAVTLKDCKDYILSYLEDEACNISREEIAEYLMKNGAEITQENIHLYYEFMSDEDIEKYKEILTEIFQYRYSRIFDNVNLHISHLVFKTVEKYYYVGQTVFGVKDNLQPIDEYIEEIKESEAYKNAKPLCQIEIPDYIQLEDFKEVPRDELFKYLDKTIGKKKWRVQTERTNIYGYRLNSSDSNKIVGLMIVRPNVSKEENTKFYICNK